MKNKFAAVFAVSCAVSCVALFSLPASRADDLSSLKQGALDEVDYARDQIFLKDQYAPAALKARLYGWNLEEELAKARAAINASASTDITTYQKIIQKLYASPHDYHVRVVFDYQEQSFLPFRVRSAQGRSFISEIDRNYLPESSYPFEVGDELLKYGGVSAAEAVKNLRTHSFQQINKKTDTLGADYALTARNKYFLDEIPTGQIDIQIKSKKTHLKKDYLVNWIYTPENGTIPTTTLSTFMDWKEGPLPDLGALVWSDPTNPFRAYIFQNGTHKIGYIRVADYQGDARMVSAFAALIEKFESDTDALVYDQLDNDGGQSYYYDALLTYLFSKPQLTDQFIMSVPQDLVDESNQNLPLLQNAKTDQDVQSILAPVSDFYGFPVDLNLASSLVEYYQFILAQKAEGADVTSPHFRRVKTIIPVANATHYTKPILILDNSLDYSCADMMPALMQDLKRATIFGETTSGAGGNNAEFGARTDSNPLSIVQYSVTISSEIRADGSFLENSGVTPDVPYEVQPEDLANGYKNYVRAVMKTLDSLVGK